MQIVSDITAEKEAEIRAKAQAAGYGTLPDFLLSLVDARSPVHDEYDEDSDGGPPTQHRRTEAAFAELLATRAKSGQFVEVTDEYFGYFGDLRKRLLGDGGTH